MNGYRDYHRSVSPFVSNEMSMPYVDPAKVTVLNDLLSENGNGKCADCSMQLSLETAWAVLSYGIFVCDDCKLVHIEEDRHFLAQEQANGARPEGFLPTNLYQHWNETDIQQMRSNGNNKVNKRYLANMPVWQYMPTANDGIKHKEYWIKYKYGTPHGENNEMPKTANKSFIGIQFTRPMPKGNYPCCAVLQNDKLYLTSSVKNEEIAIEDIETVLLNSKRIGHENGVQLTYRVKSSERGNQSDDVLFTYLQHDNMEAVLDWINLVLYTKYNICKKKYKNQSESDLAKILNCEMVKESYIPAPNHGLIYASLSEARIACFKHHLDDKPLLHLAVTKSTNLKPFQYLESIAYFFGMAADVSKILGYDDWMTAFDHTLDMDKLAALPEGIVNTVIHPKLLAPKQEVKPPVPVEDKLDSLPKSIPAAQKPNFDQENGRTASNASQEQEKMQNGGGKAAFACYPPIGPMGEMGKVARGELPPEAIKPPPPKTADPHRMYGEFKPLETVRTSVPSPIEQQMAPGPIMNNPMMPKEKRNCYPPIKGPMREAPPRSMRDPGLDMFQTNAIPENEGYVIDEYKGGNIGSSYNQINSRSMQNLNSFPNKIRTYSEAELMQYAMNQQQNGWSSGSGGGDSMRDANLLTIPWKENRNGSFEPNRNFNAQFDTWNNNPTMQDKRKVPGSQMFQGNGNSWRQENPQTLGRSVSWNPTGQSMEQWGNKQDRFFGLQSGKITRPSSGNNQQVIMENLQQCWSQAERKLHALIHNGYVPASNMTAAGLDPNSSEHAYTCIAELFELLWKRRYDLALSFLRGFREVFSRSRDAEIRNKFIGVGELDTMKQIFMQQGSEKFLSANTGGPVTWKQPSISPPTVDPWPSSNTVSRESPTSFTSPWGSLSPTTPVSETMSSVWGPTKTSGRSNNGISSFDRDPWGQSTQTSSASGSFNRAPSRPISLARNSFSEHSPTEGSFGSKASSSSSASPGVITPPTSLDAAMTSAGSLVGIETTLKNLFLSNPSGSTLWNS